MFLNCETPRKVGRRYQAATSNRWLSGLLMMLLSGSVLACARSIPGETRPGTVDAGEENKTSQAHNRPNAAEEVFPARPPAPGAVNRKPSPTAVATRPNAEIVIEAAAGEPFGVGRMTVEFPVGTGSVWYPDQDLQVIQQTHRALYPAFEVRYDRASDAPKYRVQAYTCYFLFHGQQSARLILAADREYEGTLRPTADADRHRLLLAQWWTRYRAAKKPYLGRYGTPHIIHGYLKNMLQRRLGLSDEPVHGSDAPFLIPSLVVKSVLRALVPVDLFPARVAGPPAGPPQQPSIAEQVLGGKIDTDFGLFLGVLFGMESVRVAIQADEMLSDSATREIADQEMPALMTLPPIVLPRDDLLNETEIEAIARRVPEECFYVRCGSVVDYFWLRNLVTDWGGSIDHLISMRAMDHQVRHGLERQLALSLETKFRQELDKCISDMAIVGTDVFFREGAAIGVLWEASDSEALESLLRRQRKTVWENTPQAVEREAETEGKATFLSTPDNTVRSFYAIDGKYHFVTNSSYLAKRFFEACRGVRSLGRLPEFRYARAKMPLNRDDAIFIYLSDPFFRYLTGPQYRVEMTRRMRARGDLQLVHMAQLAATSEGVHAKTPAELIRQGFLSPAFLDRSDNSRPVILGGPPIDSLRGAPGVFLPVPDVPVTRVTASEAASYREFAEKYRSQWQRMDPVSVGMTRSLEANGKREHVLMDIQITPYAREHYQALFQTLGQSDRHWRPTVAGDLLEVDMHVSDLTRLWSAMPLGQAYLFGGVRDFSAPYTISDGEINTVPLRAGGLLGTDYPAYLGLRASNARSDPLGPLDRHAGPTDASGYSQSRDAVFPLFQWRHAGNDGTFAWAHRKDILEAVVPATMCETERPSQIRFRLGDLSQSKFGPTLQAICYMHARRISTTNTTLLAELTQGFDVPPADARAVAEQLLGAKLICPLGGEYRIERQGNGVARWKSTGWPRESVYEETVVPANYRFSFLEWLHGAEIYFELTPTVLSVHAELSVTPSGNPEPIQPRPRPRSASHRKTHVADKPVVVQTPPLMSEQRPVKTDEPSESLSLPLVADRKILLEADVPDGALVIVNGTFTRTAGGFRRYVSSGLASGVQYCFELRVIMTREGHRVEQTQRVWLQAGETKRLSFTPEQAMPIDNSFAAGDVVLVTTDGAPLAVNDSVLARVPQGQQLTVLQIQGRWIWTSSDKDGRHIEGWIADDDVILFARGVPNRKPTAD